jgi:hypothetical protein
MDAGSNTINKTGAGEFHLGDNTGNSVINGTILASGGRLIGGAGPKAGTSQGEMVNTFGNATLEAKGGSIFVQPFSSVPGATVVMNNRLIIETHDLELNSDGTLTDRGGRCEPDHPVGERREADVSGCRQDANTPVRARKRSAPSLRGAGRGLRGSMPLPTVALEPFRWPAITCSRSDHFHRTRR